MALCALDQLNSANAKWSNICKAVPGLCTESKGSWCNKSGNCQNIFMTKESDLCFHTSTKPCEDATPVKCSEVEAKLKEKFLFDHARRLRNLPEDQKLKLELHIDMPPVTEMGAFCVIC